MNRIKIIHIGLICGVICFVAGIVFTSEQWRFALLAGAGLVLLGTPVCVQLNKMHSLQAKAGMEGTPGIAEYGVILAFVAVLVGVVYVVLDGYLKSAISVSMSRAFVLNEHMVI